MTNATLEGFRMMANTMQETTPTRYRVKPWPNGLGFEVTAGKQNYTVWEHGAVVRTKKNDKAPCGFENVDWHKTGMEVKNATDASIAVNKAIRAKNWTPCGG